MSNGVYRSNYLTECRYSTQGGTAPVSEEVKANREVRVYLEHYTSHQLVEERRIPSESKVTEAKPDRLGPFLEETLRFALPIFLGREDPLTGRRGRRGRKRPLCKKEKASFRT